MPFRTRVHTPRSGRREGARALPAFVPGGALSRPLACHSALRRRGMFLALEPRSRDRVRGPTARAQNGSPALPPPARPPWQVCWTLWPQGVPPHPPPGVKGRTHTLHLPAVTGSTWPSTACQARASERAGGLESRARVTGRV